METRAKTADKCPLFVDLDGTLIKSDMSLESVFFFLKKKPLYILHLFFWALRGRPCVKRRIAEQISIDPEPLPYNQEMLEFLKEEKSAGREIVLASASDYLLVKPVADYTGLFDGVIATQGDGPNLSSGNKLEAINQHTGGGPFAYIGNSSADLAVWKGAAEVLVAGPQSGFLTKVIRQFNPVKVFTVPRRPGALLRCLRVHQWSKNILVFIPVILAHRISDPSLIFTCFFAFLAFCMCASAIYILNDLFDLESDRHHTTKRNRPIAGGDVQVKPAVICFALLLAGALAICLSVSLKFTLYLGIYAVTAIAYSFSLKQFAVLDIITLAMLYTIRLLAGGAAVNVYVSEWLISFSLFFFTSLACLKRYSELLNLKARDKLVAHGRGYRTSDMELVMQSGVASALISIMVLALYVSSSEVIVLYSNHRFLWLLCPLMMYWSLRIWLLANRGGVKEDPLVFALTDKASYFVILAISALIFVSV